jgi:hypothetical protein
VFCTAIRSSGSRQTRVLLSFTVNFSRDIIFRIKFSASGPTADHEIIGIINDVEPRSIVQRLSRNKNSSFCYFHFRLCSPSLIEI